MNRSREKIQQDIYKLFKTGKTLYFSDIATLLHIPLKVVVDICKGLIKSGKIHIQQKRQ